MFIDKRTWNFTKFSFGKLPFSFGKLSEGYPNSQYIFFIKDAVNLIGTSQQILKQLFFTFSKLEFNSAEFLNKKRDKTKYY